MESNQSKPANVKLLEGSMLLQQGKFDEAKASYQQTLETEPENLEALYGVGIICQYAEEYEEAKKYFEKALSLMAENGPILNSYGVVSARLGEKDTAKKSFENAVKIDPAFLDAHKNLAELYIDSGDFEKGIQTYREILERHGEDVESLLNIAHLYYEIDDVDSTRFVLEKVLTIDPDSEIAKESLAKLEKETLKA